MLNASVQSAANSGHRLRRKLLRENWLVSRAVTVNTKTYLFVCI